ncbi:PBSX family phage terminase large subunit [Alicyclobacillus acidoterrestris]|uniref:PBSX family phage terminase large subunit n=1 Tax=Alicyclobacillus acidoterrestris TaxID=1450 RepID=UPI003F52D683
MVTATAPKKVKPAAFKFQPFSRKQKQVLTWWMRESPYHDMDAIICDGSVRAGKTVAMSLSYVMWAMETFDGQNLGMAGKTISALRRNVIIPLKRMLKSRGYMVEEHLTSNSMTIGRHGRVNEFYLFGGRDERSQDLIQGITLAGMFFDEVALMPESFVNQATARCSVTGSKYWFNCNPSGPFHWFKLNWLEDLKKKRALHLHFTMDDNLSLSEHTKNRLKSLYTGVFYQRNILGLWVVAEGAIYDMWDDELNTFDDDDIHPALKVIGKRYITIDYGTQNPMVFLDCYDDGDTIWIMNEYYYDGRARGRQKEDSEYADDLEKFIADGPKPRYVIIDPSAASFKATLRKRHVRTKDADNDVIEGIRAMSTMIYLRKLRVHRKNCPNFLMERAAYVWDDKAVKRGDEKPVKQSDHAMDACRYLVKTIVKPKRLYTA